MKVHFGNLPKSVTEGELRNLVVPFGEPSSLEIVTDTTGVSKGFAFGEFAEADQGNAVINGLDGQDLNGNSIRVAEARPRTTDARVHV